MLIPSFKIKIFSTTQKFDKAFDRAIHLRDNGHDRVITFDYCASLRHVQSFNDTTQTARVVVPRDSLYTKRNATEGIDVVVEQTASLLNVGDRAEISMSLAQSTGSGYQNGTWETIFTGYLKAITPDDNLVLEFEDEMWLLKQKKLTISYGQTTVLDMVKRMCDGIIDPVNIKGGYIGESANAQVTISGYRLKANPTIAQALHGLRKHFGIRAWFRTNENGVAELWVGRLWYENDVKINNPHIFKFQSNIISHKLTYQRQENYLKGVRAVSVSSSDNSRIEVFAGDQFGDLTTLHFFDTDAKTLKELAENHLRRISYSGFFGGFRAVINPVVKHGDFVKLIDPRFSDERVGTYVVERVTTEYDMGGAWQDIDLNTKI